MSNNQQQTYGSSTANQTSGGLSNQQYGNALDSTLPTHSQGSGYGTSGSHATSNPTELRTQGGLGHQQQQGQGQGAGFVDAVGKEGSGAGFGTAQILSGGASHAGENQSHSSQSHGGLASGVAAATGLGAGAGVAGHQGHQHGHEHGSHGLTSSTHDNNNPLSTLGTPFLGVSPTGHVLPASNLTKNSNDPVTAPSTAGGSQALNPHASELHNNNTPSSTTFPGSNTGSNTGSHGLSHGQGQGHTGAGLAGIGAGAGLGAGAAGVGLAHGEKRTEGHGADNKGLPTGAGDGPTAGLKDTLGFDPKTSGEQTGISHELPDPKKVESMGEGPHSLVWVEATQSYVHRRELDGKGSTGVPLNIQKKH